MKPWDYKSKPRARCWRGVFLSFRGEPEHSASLSSVLEFGAARFARGAGPLTCVVESGAVGRLCRSKLLAVERAVAAEGGVKLEGSFTCLAHDDADGVTANFDDVGL